MPVLKVDASLYDLPQALAAGPEALGCWLLLAAYSARNLTDGYVTEAIASRICGASWERGRVRLLQSGMANEEKGSIALRFFDVNPTRAKAHAIASKRKAAGQRGGLAKSKQKPSNLLDSKPSVTIEEKPKTAHDRYAEAYAKGQIEAGAEAYPWEGMTQQEQGALAQMCAFSGKRRGDELLQWFTATSREYRQSADATYNPGYRPSRCLLWLQGGKPKSKGKQVQPSVSSEERCWEIGGQ